MKRLLTSLVLLCFVMASALANINYVDFSDVTDLTMNGDTIPVEGALRVSSAAEGSTGSAYYNVKQPINGQWQVDFDFRITDKDELFGGADGFSFIIQNDNINALGGGGSGMGYDGIPYSVAIEFDTFDVGEGPNDNHISVQTRGTEPNSWDPLYSYAMSDSIPDMSDGAIHHVRITFSNFLMSIYLDDMEIPAVLAEMNLLAMIDAQDGTAWLGFTAGCGGGFENHDILNWQYTQTSTFVTWYNVTQGFEFQGDVASLYNFDGNQLCLLNDDVTLATEIEIYGQTTATGNDYQVEIAWDITRPGLSITIDLLTSTGNWANVYGGTQVGQGGIGIQTAASFFVGPFGELGTRLHWQPINDEDPSQDGWAICLDWVHWTIS